MLGVLPSFLGACPERLRVVGAALGYRLGDEIASFSKGVETVDGPIGARDGQDHAGQARSGANVDHSAIIVRRRRVIT